MTIENSREHDLVDIRVAESWCCAGLGGPGYYDALVFWGFTEQASLETEDVTCVLFVEQQCSSEVVEENTRLFCEEMEDEGVLVDTQELLGVTGVYISGDSHAKFITSMEYSSDNRSVRGILEYLGYRF
jgi:hypothetical protein